jgi:hypothetical protein
VLTRPVVLWLSADRVPLLAANRGRQAG